MSIFEKIEPGSFIQNLMDIIPERYVEDIHQLRLIFYLKRDFDTAGHGSRSAERSWGCMRDTGSILNPICPT